MMRSVMERGSHIFFAFNKIKFLIYCRGQFFVNIPSPVPMRSHLSVVELMLKQLSVVTYQSEPFHVFTIYSIDQHLTSTTCSNHTHILNVFKPI